MFSFILNKVNNNDDPNKLLQMVLLYNSFIRKISLDFSDKRLMINSHNHMD